MSTNDGMTLLATAGERIEQPTGVVLNQGHEIRATDPRLGRVPLFDYRSRDYPVRALVPDRAQPQGKHWYCRQRLDQGNPDGIAKFSASACTGHSRTLDLAASPNPLKMEIKDRHSVPFTRQYAHALYRLAQTLDDWPGELYEGSSGLRGRRCGTGALLRGRNGDRLGLAQFDVRPEAEWLARSRCQLGCRWWPCLVPESCHHSA
jgi:hypothetical protein